MSRDDRTVIRRVPVDGVGTSDEYLKSVIRAMEAILSDLGFTAPYPWPDENNPLKNYPAVETQTFAALAVVHAHAALKAMEADDVEKTAHNSMRAENYKTLAQIRASNIERDIWHGRKVRTSAGKTPRQDDVKLLEKRRALVRDLKQQQAPDKDIPRKAVFEETNKTPTKQQTDAMRKYLQKHGLIEKASR